MKLRTLAVAAFAALVVGCSGGSEKDRFVKECTDGGANQKVCGCMYDGLTEKYSFKEIEAMGDTPDPEFATTLVTVMLSCAVK